MLERVGDGSCGLRCLRKSIELAVVDGDESVVDAGGNSDERSIESGSG